MTDQTAQPEPKPAEASTLEDLYNEYDVQPKSPPQTPPEPAAPVQEKDTAILREVASLRRELQEDKQSRLAKEEENDFNSAVATLAHMSGLKDMDDVLGGYLITRAGKDKRLERLWESRKNNPTAWSKALGILATEVKGKITAPNPQLEENQRAMDESQRAITSTAPPQSKPEDEIMRMNDADFSNFWNRLARGA